MLGATDLSIQQGVFKKKYSPIRVCIRQEQNLHADEVTDFLKSFQDDFVGVAYATGTRCQISTVALSSSTEVLVIRFSGPSKGGDGSATPLETVFRDRSLCKVVVRADRLAASLHLDLERHIRNVLDLSSLSRSEDLDVAKLLSSLCGESTVHVPVLRQLFQDMRYNPDNVALRAWVTCQVAVQQSSKIIAQARKLDTMRLQPRLLHALSESVRSADHKYALKPTVAKNDVKAGYKLKSGKLHVESDRYKTRVRASSTQAVLVSTTTKKGTLTQQSRVSQVRGRAATINIKNISGSHIEIRTIGKDPLTRAENQRQYVIWLAFHGQTTINDMHFFRVIWYSETTPRSGIVNMPPPIHFPARQLNPSQEKAVRAIISKAPSDRVTVVHGPPGTGKTTVIAAAVCTMSSQDQRCSIWLVAHSNVAVKNIAEKLADVDFLKFRLLVSEEFQFDWHEHLYERIEPKVIRSDKFPKNNLDANRLLLDAQVILCTLSMLSNPNIRPFTALLPVSSVIVDEASQIEIGDYLPLIYHFNLTLNKLVFIGDDKQLPPFGQEDIPNLRSVFEVQSLREGAIFLDTQYRMPQVIGAFISRHVYDDKLKTVHPESSWKACRFVDVLKGVEQSSGHSWINQEEAHAAVRVAQKLHAEGNSFKIITPYDPQRNLIEKQLKADGVPWEDRCFNVDSFQGNEEDHIIISVVRSAKLGFLSNARRSNVMLSRCKKSMIICSSRGFLGGVGASSLAGILATECGGRAWISWKDVLMNRW